MRSIYVAVAVAALFCATPITANTNHHHHHHHPHHHPKVGASSPTEVEWTFLLFLNGNNNLDSWGTFNIQQMITIGSQPWLNLVVQQASLSKNDTQRLFITKGNAQVVQDLGGGVEMGDVSTWEDFLQWGVTNYPAKHYFVSIWDHGTGWHYVRGTGSATKKPQLGDISCNDDFDRCISTTQLGDALARFKRIIGRNVDVFATDACSMQMIEIAAEISDYADYFVASETAIPDQGWPYDTWLAQWVAAGPAADPKLVASFISSQFLTAYSVGGEYAKQRDQDTTQSYLHLVHIKSTLDAIKALGSLIVGFNQTNRESAFKAVPQSVCFSEPDSCDVVSFANLVAQAVTHPDLQQAVVRLDAAVHLLVAQHGGTGQFENNVSGLAIWLPANTDIYYLFDHNTRYETLKFEQYTQWGQALRYMLLGK